MQTQLLDSLLETAEGREADAILRSCVHCGFCTATCPTYQLLGDERDGPRGRIYLIKQVLEGSPAGAGTQMHLDRCLTCRSCETTCPSGVRYGRLLDIARPLVDAQVARPWLERLQRRLLRWMLPYPQRFTPLARLGHILRPILPAPLRSQVPRITPDSPWPQKTHARRMLVLEGCVQPALAPSINAATARVLDRMGIHLLTAKASGCCGAVSYHLNAHEEGLQFMRRNIDAWEPYLDQGVEAIVITASGCGLMVKEYAAALAHDPKYAQRAARISAAARDLVEILEQEELDAWRSASGARIAFQSPCTLQHGQRLAGRVEAVLSRLGFHLSPVAEAHLCCGSAGTYSILQPQLSRRLLKNKLESLQAGDPEVIVTANIGCLTHLQTAAKAPVRHWIEVVDQMMAG
ncbi:glycolate oxidase subunit GlcF [Methyloterricola oryzae]|uniref:glycolate oxidase subunit GlcF n=1 Tax=Methyloterricola oryzae TaxID=1495050 RepID=UPI0005EB69FE|nr:glycolate oxidase subunit GlcF [Methyloterricola oryzae]